MQITTTTTQPTTLPTASIAEINSATGQVAAQWWTDQLTSGDKTAFQASLSAGIEGSLKLPGPHVVILVSRLAPGILLDAVVAAGVIAKDIIPTELPFPSSELGMMVGHGQMRVRKTAAAWDEPLYVVLS